jgi:pimeloyl-ACP methyl ester carboxylesterase
MRVRVGDVRLFFDVQGARLVPDGTAMLDRPTLILLSGGPGFDHSVFRPSYDQLADVAQVVYLDFRGHGRSERGDPTRWTVSDWSDDLHRFCDSLGIERPIVLGWSFGGMVAMSHAIRYADDLAALVLQSTRARLNVDGLVEAFQRAGGNEAAEVARTYWTTGGADALAAYARTCAPLYGPGEADPDELGRAIYNVELLNDPGAVLRDVDLAGDLGSVRCPTLVVAGDLDPWGGVEAANEIVSALPRDLVRFERFDGAGHHIHHDAPDRFFALLREFIVEH